MLDGDRIMNKLPDVQETKPEIQMHIREVGVGEVEVPFRLESREGGFHDIVAKVSMFTDLPSNKKGISMSRLLLALRPYLNIPLKSKMIFDITKDLAKSQDTIYARIKFKFKLPRNRKSPVTDHEFPLFHDCMFEGTYFMQDAEPFFFKQGVKVQYASYCPCSAELSKHLEEQGLKGFPHAQRSFAEVVIETQENKVIWLEDIIDIVEDSIATLPYPIVKREDEQEIAKIAANNPLFVEDAIRQISNALECNRSIRDWAVRCTHEESIHTSTAVAVSWKGLDEGLRDASIRF